MRPLDPGSAHEAPLDGRARPAIPPPALELPAPDGATVARAAISAAEALRLLRSATGWKRHDPDVMEARLADVARRLDEALVAVRVLGATLEDAERYEDATTARSIAGRLRLADVEARDVEGFEAWCREIAAAVRDALRATEPEVTRG